jgi:hydroxypyruvate isomerase
MSTVKQSFVWDPFARTGVEPERLVRGAVEMGYQGVELVPQEYWPLVKDHGLAIISAAGHPLAPEGLNRRENLPLIEKEILQKFELAVKWGIPYLLCFSGNRYGVDDTTAAEITAENLRHLADLAQDTDIVLLMELLNSKVADRDYQADKSAWGIRVCKMVDSPHVKLLYDIYHMQIMEGDLISTIRTGYECFGHYHTAGNPGRSDLDHEQELYYPAIVRAILDTDYKGYIGHEFFPKGDAVEALKAAFDICNVGFDRMERKSGS